MLFQVTRTSHWSDEKPCEDCFPIKLKLNSEDVYRDCWGIELNTIEELMKFKDSVDEALILRTSYVDDNIPCIEIYDDYRENNTK